MDHKTTKHLMATNEVDYNFGTTKQQNKNGGYNYLQVTFGGFLVSLLLELEICFTFLKFLSFLRGWLSTRGGQRYSLSDGQWMVLLLMLNVSLDCWNLVKNERDRGTIFTKVRSSFGGDSRKTGSNEEIEGGEGI